MKKLIPILLVLLLSTLTFAVTQKNVTYKSGNETVNAVLYTPDGNGPFPALIVIHEWWGLNDWVKEQAQKLAENGYETLAIDLYRGKVATTPEEAHEIMRGVPEDRANRDLLAAYDYLAAQANVNKNKIGAIGWCMGGGYALDLALAQPKLAVTVINYGHLATDDAQLKKIDAKILGIFGEQDRGIPPDSVKAFEQQLKKLGKSVETKIYPDAGHAFENPNNKSGYRADDAQDAWKLTLDFLNKNLKR
ncbi:MAG: dienelactone hydrolase family protein [Acidobacteriaceae bacterium]